jgi:hypothetical protein
MSMMRRRPEMHLHCGIPVVKVEGEWDEMTGSSLTELVSGLVSAGHVEIIVNLTRMTRSSLSDRVWLEALEGIAATVRTHFGRVDVVASLEQVTRSVYMKAHSRLFWATSEEEAMGHIKGVPVYCGGPILTTRLIG